MVAARPCSKVYWGAQPVSSRSLVESPSRRLTSLLFGAQTLGLADDLGVRVDLGDQLVGQITDGMLNARRNVQLLANRGVAVGNRHKAVGRVL